MRIDRYEIRTKDDYINALHEEVKPLRGFGLVVEMIGFY
jgi:hypothetical protein